jgi:ribosomal protein S18 acetylase RimI-like enzyme
MSFGTYARRVRDSSLPLKRRHTSLRCAVERYMPMGFHSTLDYLASRTGQIRTDEDALLGALDILETSRRAWLAEMAAFARRRTVEKHDRRTVSVDEHRYRHGWRWPGPDAHEAMHHTIRTLWDRHEREPCPEVPAIDHADLLRLDATVAEIVPAYLRRSGSLRPDHREILRRCATESRAVRLSFPESSTYFIRLIKMTELLAHDALPLLRRAQQEDAEQITEVFLTARSRMTYLPGIHTDEETAAWIAEAVLPRHEVWVAELHGRVAGFAVLRDHWLDHLYVAPYAQGGGIGAALLAQVKRRRPVSLSLYVFQANSGARRFYVRHGFTPMALGDGGDNEENLPDARYVWRPDPVR